MYTRSPGGILIECTSNVPGGFYQDEAPDELGTHLLLPPWFEDQRAAIVAQLEPITVPEENRPKPGTMKVPAAVLAGTGTEGRIGSGVGRAALALPGEIRRQELETTVATPNSICVPTPNSQVCGGDWALGFLEVGS